MARIAIAWELGGGLGHIGRLQPIAGELIEMGHSVTLICRNLTLSYHYLNPLGVVVLPAPRLPESQEKVPQVTTFADVLFNCGFSNVNHLAAAVHSWQACLDLVEPDFLLLDHSPTALMASRKLSAPKAVIGTGFICPPSAHDFPSLATTSNGPQERIAVDETVLENINQVLVQLEVTRLSRIPQLFAAVDRQYLLTLPELDHYPERENADYRRPICELSGRSLAWPDAPGPRIFIYLRSHPNVLQFLDLLRTLPSSIIVYSPQLTPESKQKYVRTNIHVSNEPLDIHQACVESDLGVHNGGHGVTCEFLLSGKPQLLLPLTLEQRVTTERVESLGVGLGESVLKPAEAYHKCYHLLRSSEHLRKARDVAAKYSNVNQADSIREIVEDVAWLAEQYSASKM